MKTKLLNDRAGAHTYAVVFEKGDEVVRGLTEFAERHGLAASHLTGFGAFERVTLGYFDRERKEYRKIPLHEQVEVLSLVGDIVRKDGKPALHAHVVVGKADGTAHGGHLLEAHVWPTLEVVLVETPRYLYRRYDPATGLALIQPDDSDGA
jgi:predicted DNA-binding protein with PD1-like motif